MHPKSIAVVGSGISGLSAAWLLSRHHRVTLIEADSRIGGHTNTVSADTVDGPVPVDTGFIVYNEANYPNLTALFDHLKVPTSASHMGFAASLNDGQLEYNGEKLVGLFGQPSNLFRREHWQLVTDILRFFRNAEAEGADLDAETSIGEFLAQRGYSRAFIDDHLLPVSAAIWSTPSRGMLDFPARTFINFFSNHGLLKIAGRPSWRTVLGGSQEYVSRLLADSRLEIRTGAPVAAIRRTPVGVSLTTRDGQHAAFDDVVLACHADQALAMLADASPDERNLLGAFRFSPNTAILHKDATQMPRRRRLWCSWNYLRPGNGGSEAVSVSYWMNRLQPLATREDLFVTLNPVTPVAADKIVYTAAYEHPIFDAAAVAAQHEFGAIQGVNRTWFAGAWLGYGFHEDGLQSGLEVAERLGGVSRPWQVEHQSGRVAHTWHRQPSARWAA